MTAAASVQGTVSASDAELVRQVLAGDRGTFAALVRRHNQRLFRACRAVLDVTLQCGRMTEGEAADYLVTEAMLDRPTAEAEIKRYVLTPTQPMSYLVGKTLLLELRDEAKRRLGPRFDLNEFHAALLQGGTLPPALLREEIWDRLPVGKRG